MELFREDVQKSFRFLTVSKYLFQCATESSQKSFLNLRLRSHDQLIKSDLKKNGLTQAIDYYLNKISVSGQ